MVPMRDSGIVEATHEPYPLIPSFSPSGGEGARRAVEGGIPVHGSVESVHKTLRQVKQSFVLDGPAPPPLP